MFVKRFLLFKLEINFPIQIRTLQYSEYIYQRVKTCFRQKQLSWRSVQNDYVFLGENIAVNILNNYG